MNILPIHVKLKRYADDPNPFFILKVRSGLKFWLITFPWLVLTRRPMTITIDGVTPR